MDLKQVFAKIRSSAGKFALWTGVAVAGVIALTVLVRSGPTVLKSVKVAGAATIEYLSIGELFEIYGQAFISVQKKVDALRSAEERARALSMENAKLRLERETAEFDCQSRIAENTTRRFESTLSQKTGSAVGRIPASISYRPPENITAHQLLTLGRAFFKEREDEKAAVIFTTVTGLDVSTFQTAEIQLLAGISWYRLDHLELANSYFDKVLEKASIPENLRYQAQARLWKALASARAGKKMKAQYWLRELVDNHPHSRETQWINSGRAGRVPASKH